MLRKWPIVLTLSLLIAARTHAEPVVVPEFAVADRLVPEDPLTPATRTLRGSVVLQQDVVYATVPGFRRLRLDLYAPATASAALPLVVFLHGGGWKLGSPRAGGAFRSFPDVLAWFASRGYVVASIEYRLSGEATFPAPLRDLEAALGYLRANAASLHVDPARIGLWGMSAGAYLSALEAVGCNAPVASAVAMHGAPGSCVRALVGWFGVYDLANTNHPADYEGSIRALLGCGTAPCTTEALAAASPINYVAAGDPPTLLVHGANDPLPAAESVQFADRLRRSGVPVELLIVPGVSHGLVGPTLDSTSEANRGALMATAEFLDARLRPSVAGKVP